MDGVPYEIPVQGGLKVDGGQSRCFEIDCPGRAILSKLILAKINGDCSSFKVELFNHEGVCDQISVADSVGDLQGPVNEELFRICPPMMSSVDTITGRPRVQYFAQDGSGGYGYQIYNQDHRADPTRRGSVPRKVYMRITVDDGTGEQEFALSMGVADWA